VFIAQESFVIRHQNAVVYIELFLAVMMLTGSLGLIFMQHINIIHVITMSSSSGDIHHTAFHRVVITYCDALLVVL